MLGNLGLSAGRLQSILLIEEPLRFESGSFETLIRLVDAGLGSTVLPKLVVDTLPDRRRRGQVRPFARPVPVREVSFIRLREHLRRAVADAIADTLEELLAEREPRRGAEVVVAPILDE